MQPAASSADIGSASRSGWFSITSTRMVLRSGCSIGIQQGACQLMERLIIKRLLVFRRRTAGPGAKLFVHGTGNRGQNGASPLGEFSWRDEKGDGPPGCSRPAVSRSAKVRPSGVLRRRVLRNDSRVHLHRISGVSFIHCASQFFARSRAWRVAIFSSGVWSGRKSNARRAIG